MSALNVLIVEDSMLVASAVKIILKKEGIESMITDEGRKVIDIVKKEGIKLIVLDLMMPGFSGVDVFKELKKDKTLKDVKIMILTAKTDALKWYPELKAADKFMNKPFDNDELAREVKKLLK
jgi:DNA-binding response OmpR family regulator